MKLSVQKLSKVYKDAGADLLVIDSLSVEFNQKSIAITGPSGIGKSTFLNILGGLEKPSAGRVLYDDVDIFSLNDEQLTKFRGDSVGFIFQFHHLLPEFVAWENVAMPLIIKGVSEVDAKKAANDLLVDVGLGERVMHRPSELSGGEQQRVAIARALISSPKIVLADEPTGNLDIHTANIVQKLLLELSNKKGTTLVVVTHNNDLAKEMELVYEMSGSGALNLCR